MDEDLGREATTPAAVTALAQLGGSLPGLPALESLAIRREYTVVVPLAAHTERALCRLLGKAAATLSGGSHPLRCGKISGRRHPESNFRHGVRNEIHFCLKQR